MNSESPAWRGLARVIAILSWALVAGALVLAAVTGEAPLYLADWIMDLVVATIYPVVILVMLPRTRVLAVWVLVALALGCALAAFAEQYAPLGESVPWLPLQGFAAVCVIWVWIPGTYGILAVLPWLIMGEPTGAAGLRLPGGGGAVGSRVDLARIVRRIAIGAACVAIAMATLRNATITRSLPGPANPFEAPAVHDWLAGFGALPDWTVTAIGACALISVVIRCIDRRRTRHPSPGLGWLVAAQTLLLIAFLLFLWPTPPEQALAAGQVSGVALLIAQAFLSASVLVLVLGNRLWGIDVTVSRALTWTTMTVLLVASYFTLTAVLGLLLPVRTDLQLVIAAAAFALAIAPARSWVQRRVDRLIYGELGGVSSGSETAMWQTLGGSAGSLDGDLTSTAEALRAGLRLGRLEIVEAGAVARPAAEGTLVLPLRSRDRTVGELRAAARTGERLDARSLATLDQLTELLALVVDLRQSNEALRLARLRLSDIREDERRTLRRDLHDGLGPAIAGLRLAVGGALKRLATDPEGSRAMVEQVYAELDRLGEDARMLSRSLLPPQLDDGDLPGALATLAHRFTSGALLVTAEVDPGLELRDAAKLTVYHVASEALTNVHRHAQATACRIRVIRTDEGVELHVTDDGVGIDDVHRRIGVGTASMRERIEEIGGSLFVGPRIQAAREGDPPGTHVRALLPLAVCAV